MTDEVALKLEKACFNPHVYQNIGCTFELYNEAGKVLFAGVIDAIFIDLLAGPNGHYFEGAQITTRGGRWVVNVFFDCRLLPEGFQCQLIDAIDGRHKQTLAIECAGFRICC
jgi:hypothetical protein